MNQIDLVALSQLEPAVYNPRETDPFRLRLLQLSLTKLGFILPLYAMPTGHLLSGHQRMLAAELLGAKHVPVVRATINEKRKENVNVIFNRTTNDMRVGDTSDKLLKAMNLDYVTELAASIPDKQPDTPEFYRCMSAQLRSIDDLLEMEKGPYEEGAIAAASTLLRMKLFMPIVVTDTGKVINGTYRLYAAADQQSKWGKFGEIVPKGMYPTVTISEAEGELATLLLNMISMRFTLERQYADKLRFGAFRRPSNLVEDLVASIRFWPDGCKSKSAQQSLKDPPKFWSNLRRELGESFLDFGAGQRRNEEILAKKGIECVSWEPYPVVQEGRDPEFETADSAGEPNLQLAQRLTDNLLDKVASGTVFSSIVMSAVLNSVPFEADRRHILLIVNALCSMGTRVIGSVRHVRVKDKVTAGISNKGRMTSDGKIGVAMAVFSLDYEPNLTIGDISVMPKVQRFHTPEECDALLKMFFMKTEVYDCGAYVQFRATAPRRPDPKLLKKALLHEFNLPYRDGQTLDRGRQALEAFGRRLKINFDEVPDE